jgi:hypothetical protein
MKLSIAFLFLPFAVSNAHADGVHESTMPAIQGGLELGLSLGSSTSVGDVGGGMDSADLIGTAAQVEIKVGRRITPNLAVSFYSAAQGLTEGSTSARSVYTGTAGAMADFHLRPHAAVDPFISVGGGLAAMLISQDGITLDVGVELARLQTGIDVRINKDFSIGPVIGASAALYGAERTPMRDFAEIDNKGINWTLSAGVAGRFDAFGTRN